MIEVFIKYRSSPSSMGMDVQLFPALGNARFQQTKLADRDPTLHIPGVNFAPGALLTSAKD